MAADEVKVQFGGDAGPLKRSTTEAVAATKSAAAAIEQSIAHLNHHVTDQMSAVRGSFTRSITEMMAVGEMLGGVIAGALSVEALKSAVEGAFTYKEHLESLTRVMGMTAEEASVLEAGLKLAGVSTETYTGANIKLAMHLKANEAGLNQLGVATRNVNGDLVSQTELFNHAFAAMLQYKEGADRNQFSLYAFGRGTQEVYKLQELTGEVMDRARELAHQYGLVLGGEAVEQMEKYQHEVAEVDLLNQAMQVRIGQALLPELARLSGWFSQVGPDAIDAAAFAIKVLITGLEGLFLVVRMVYDGCEMLFTYVGKSLATIAAAAVAVARGDFQGAWDALNAGAADVGQTWSSQMENVVAVQERTWQRVQQTWSKDPLRGAKPGGGASKPEAAQGTKAFVSPEKNTGRVEEWRESLTRMKDAEHSWLDFSKQRELDFWTAKLALTKRGGKEYAAVFHEVAALKKAVAKDEFDQGVAALRVQMESEKTSGEERSRLAQQIAVRTAAAYGAGSVQHQAALQRVEHEQQAHLQKMRQLHEQEIEQTKAHALALVALEETRSVGGRGAAGKEDLAALQGFEAQRYQIELQALNRKLALDGVEPLERQKLLKQIEQLDDAHRLKVQELDNQAAQQARELAELAKATDQQRALAAIAVKEQELGARVQLDQLSKDAELATAKALEEEKYRIELAGLQARLALAENGPIERAKLNQEIEALAQKHSLTLQKLDVQDALAKKQAYASLVEPATQALDQITIGILRGNQTGLQAIRNFAADVVISYANMVAKMLIHWMIGQSTQTEIEQVETVKRLAIQAAAVAENLAMQAITAAKSIMNAAATAAAWMFADVAEASGPAAPVAAPTAAAGAFALVAGFAGSLASAAGGWDVPADRLALIHKQEMVLPAPLANRVRDMTEPGGAGREIHIHAVDAKSFERLLADHSSSVYKALAGEARNFRGR